MNTRVMERSVDKISLGAHLFFLVGGGRPVVGHAPGQSIVRHLLHQGKGLAGTETWRRLPENRGGGIEIVAGDQLGAQDPVDFQEGSHRHHFPQGIPDVKVIDVLPLEAIRGVSLDVDLENLVELIEKD